MCVCVCVCVCVCCAFVHQLYYEFRIVTMQRIEMWLLPSWDMEDLHVDNEIFLGNKGKKEVSIFHESQMPV